MNKHMVSKGNQFGRIIYFILLSVFFLTVVTQFFLAGLAIFVDPINWSRHTTLIHLVGFNIPLFLLLFAFIGKLPRWAYWNIFGLLVGVFGMYFTANITASIRWLGALHPVLAILLFIISYQGIKKTIKLMFIKKGEE
ncbi:DUF6220 domain-containing protein [Lederbergia graminis]|uniref:DUF6220 domain-containing protein n=1 Tax=Lederbergia graminis TaxID=735518 RepID=A0ABW0LHB5_9BACI